MGAGEYDSHLWFKEPSYDPDKQDRGEGENRRSGGGGEFYAIVANLNHRACQARGNQLSYLLQHVPAFPCMKIFRPTVSSLRTHEGMLFSSSHSGIVDTYSRFSTGLQIG